MNVKFRVYSVVIFIILLFGSDGVHAQWLSAEIPVCTKIGSQENTQLIPDGAGGVIAVWNDIDIYTQRIDANGNAVWSGNSVAICTAAGLQTQPQIISDGSMGAIIVWKDERSGAGDIYAQRIDANGNTLWTTDGMPICSAAGNQSRPKVTSDGEGGAIIVWEDSRDAVIGLESYAQKISSEGNVLWLKDGVKVIPDNWIGDISVTIDGNGGAIIVNVDSWPQYVMALRINANGELSWGSYYDVRVCEADGGKGHINICADGVGGAFITWRDRRSGDNDIYIQRIDNGGTCLWETDGVKVCSAADDQYYPDLVRDGNGGVIVTWVDKRSGDYGIYAQRMDATGNFIWTQNGIAVRAAQGNQVYESNYFWGLDIALNGASGAIITWHDFRNDNSDIYAQLINPDGTVLWETDGIEICAVDSAQSHPRIVSNRPGDSFIAWTDMRSGDMDIYGVYVAEEAPILDALMDIRPGSSTNPLNLTMYENKHDDKLPNPKKGGVLPVAVLGTPDMYVRDIDVSSVLLEGVAPLRYSYEDVATPTKNTGPCSYTTEGPDGYEDLTLKFLKSSFAEALGDISSQTELVLLLTGQLQDGMQFEARDCVAVVGNIDPKRKVGKIDEVLLHTASPNPLNPSTRIGFYLPEATFVNISVYDVKGALVARLVDGMHPAGEHLVEWNPRNIASGIYFYRLVAGEIVQTKKMVLLR